MPLHKASSSHSDSRILPSSSSENKKQALSDTVRLSPNKIY